MTKKKKQGAEGGAGPEAAGAAEGAAPDGAEAVTGGEAPSDLYSLRQLASMLKVDRHRLAEQVRTVESYAGPNRSRLYSLAAVEEALAAAADPELAEARRRKLQAEAELAELKLGREKGELCEARDVQTLILNIFRAWRQRLAVTMPREVSLQLHRAESADHVAEVLRVEVTRMLNEFSQDHLRFINNTEGFEGGMTHADACGVYD